MRWFTDDVLASKQLTVDGYRHFSSFLSPDDVARACGLYEEVLRRSNRPMGDEWWVTTLLGDSDVSALIDGGLRTIVSPRLNRIADADSIQMVLLDFAIKPPSTMSELGPHADHSITDESRARGAYLWIPLQDTNEYNGTLYVVPGSHNHVNRVRSLHVPARFDGSFEEIRRSAVRIDCQAGDMVAMSAGLVHFSPPNQSETPRPALFIPAIPIDEPLLFYYCDDATPEGWVEAHEVSARQYVAAFTDGRAALEGPPSMLVPKPNEISPW